MRKTVIYITVLMIVGACGVKKNINVKSEGEIIEKRNLHIVKGHINSTLCSLSSTHVIEEEIREIDTAGRTTRVITRHYDIKENSSTTSCDTTMNVAIDTSARYISHTGNINEKTHPTTSHKIYLWVALALAIVAAVWWIKKKIPFL